LRLSTWQAVYRPPPSTPPISLDHGFQVHLQTRSLSASKVRMIMAFQCNAPDFVDHGLQMHLQTRSITAYKFISKLVRLRPPSAYLQTCSITDSQCISQLTQSRPPSASRNLLNHGLQVRTILASKRISKRSRTRSLSESLSSFDYGLNVYLQICLITTTKCICKLAWSQPQWVSLSSLDRHFQVHLALLSSTAYCQSRYTVCRWVAIWIHRSEYKLNTLVLKIVQ